MSTWCQSFFVAWAFDSAELLGTLVWIHSNFAWISALRRVCDLETLAHICASSVHWVLLKGRSVFWQIWLSLAEFDALFRKLQLTGIWTVSSVTLHIFLLNRCKLLDGCRLVFVQLHLTMLWCVMRWSCWYLPSDSQVLADYLIWNLLKLREFWNIRRDYLSIWPFFIEVCPPYRNVDLV